MTDEERQLIKYAKVIIEEDRERQLENSTQNMNNVGEVNGLAISSLILSVISIFVSTILIGMTSLILGFIALDSPIKGRGLGSAGIIISICSVALYAFSVMLGYSQLALF